jgi:hypothetical protein
MVFTTIRNYFNEFKNTKLAESKFFQRFGTTAPQVLHEHLDTDLRRLQASYHDKHHEKEITANYLDHIGQTHEGFEISDRMKGEPFEFYRDCTPDEIPPSRHSAPGIRTLPVRLHTQQVVIATSDVPETGFQLHPLLKYLIISKYPTYMQAVIKYCRPLGTTDATFNDFNREQTEYPSVPIDTTHRIVNLVCRFINATPFLPLHYVDTFFCKMPLSTGTSYFYRHSYDQRTHAAFSHPEEYQSKQTSKGYFYNSFTEWARTIVHRIKEFQLPFSPENLSPLETTLRLRRFFIEHCTLLFTRNHISDRDGTLKQRPVYAMDTLFLHLEAMVTFPLHILARSTKSSLMYSLETIRGGCSYMDVRARAFTSYLCIDWSSFDQRMPWIIVDTFFTVFLPALLVINHGYQPTAEYPIYPDLTADKLFSRLYNIICFLRTWYFNCVFATADGYAYVRLFAGIASGMLNTQYLDSYCNLFLIIHALIHFGCSDQEILELVIFVMGDDNVVLSIWTPDRLHSFMLFFEQHALSRFGMVLSTKKSIFTTLRTKIEMLGYRCNGGNPRRPLDKLIAQLCYPEHGPVDKYMSSRAVGMAWAAAGQDADFHSFCYDVYRTFEPYHDVNYKQDISKILKHLPGVFKMLDNPEEFVNVERFPSIMEVRNRYEHWQGELDPFKKWSPSHFMTPPGIVPPDSVTMTEYMLEHSLVFPDVERLF